MQYQQCNQRKWKWNSGVFGIIALFFASLGCARELPTIAKNQLPPEAHHTLQLIQQRGPFPYEKDGSIFANYERQLPWRPHGYYTEYTVKTPGIKGRGPRRIILGKDRDNPLRQNQEYYYTENHYRNFWHIQE